MKIGIIGAGWYGCHLALKLMKAGCQIILFEKKSDIFLKYQEDLVNDANNKLPRLT